MGATMILVTTQVFPPTAGGIQNLMASLCYYAATNAKNGVHVFADKTSGASRFDHEMRDTYQVTRIGGLKPFRRRWKGHLVSQATMQQNVSHIFADSWKSVEHLSASVQAPVIAFAHGNEFPTDLSKKQRIRRCLEKVNHLIAVSKDTRERILPFLPEKNIDVRVITPPVSPCHAATTNDRQAADAIWKHQGLRILCLCRLIDMKGVDATIKAVARLLDEGIEAELVVAGVGPDRIRLDAIVKTEDRGQGLRERVHFAGYVEGGHKTALLESADIYMQPGRAVRQEREAFGISYLEAGLCSLPSIAGRAGGASEAVIHGKTGLIVDGGDDEAIYQSLARLCNDKTLRVKLGGHAREHAQQSLWPRQIDKFLSLG